MGYWNEHPMAGDQPLDHEYLIRLQLLMLDGMPDEYVQEAVREMFDQDDLGTSKLKFLLETYLHTYLKNNSATLDEEFVLPYMVAQTGACIKDPADRLTLKAMIKDGGSLERGYPSFDEPPCKENEYHDFTTPECYATWLYDNWDDIMNCENRDDMYINSPLYEKGLFETIFEGLNDEKSGLVNTR